MSIYIQYNYRCRVSRNPPLPSIEESTRLPRGQRGGKACWIRSNEIPNFLLIVSYELTLAKCWGCAYRVVKQSPGFFSVFATWFGVKLHEEIGCSGGREKCVKPLITSERSCKRVD